MQILDNITASFWVCYPVFGIDEEWVWRHNLHLPAEPPGKPYLHLLVCFSHSPCRHPLLVQSPANYNSICCIPSISPKRSATASNPNLRSSSAILGRKMHNAFLISSAPSFSSKAKEEMFIYNHKNMKYITPFIL